MKYLLAVLLTTSLLFLSNCMTNVEDTGGVTQFDPSEISYADDIQVIFDESCGGGNCHLNRSVNGVNLSSYAQTMNSVGTSYQKNIVIKGEPDNSPLVDVIEPNPENINNRMPLTGGALTADEIGKIRAWIEAGADDN